MLNIVDGKPKEEEEDGRSRKRASDVEVIPVAGATPKSKPRLTKALKQEDEVIAKT